MISTSGPCKYHEQESGGYELEEPCWVDLAFKAAEARLDKLRVEQLEPGKYRMHFDAGFEWDGASGPTIDTPDSVWPALMHDGGYRLLKHKRWHQSLRIDVDRQFRDMLIERGMSKLRALTWFVAVRLFGSKSASKSVESKHKQAA